MKILAFSDVHGAYDRVENAIRREGDADLVFIAGDLTTRGSAAEATDAIRRFSALARAVVVVAGNMDPPELEDTFEGLGVGLNGHGVEHGSIGLCGVSAAPLSPLHTPYEVQTKISKDELDEIINTPSDEIEESGKKGGRPNGLVELTTKLVEKGLLTPCEGEEDFSKYSVKDFEELFEANTKEKAAKTQEEISAQFFESLPEELQVAAHYVANGGNDLKSLFRSLAAVEEIRELDVEDADSQEQIVRSYLHATNFGNADEIEEEIEAWKDRDELGAKAKKFKPKLDAMQEQIVARKLQQQEAMRKQQQQQAAIQVIGKINDPILKLTSIGNFGWMMYSTGKVRLAIENYEKALAIAKELKSRQDEAVWLGNLGVAYFSLGNTNQSIEYIEQAYIFHKEIGDQNGQSTSLNNLGEL